MADGFIKPADIGIAPGEKPVVWFSANQFWEETVWKVWVSEDNKTTRELSMGGLHDVCGIYRIGVAAETAPLTWDDIKTTSGMPEASANGLQRVARERGAKPKEWRGTFKPVPKDKWIAVEKFDGLAWKEHRP